jgi:hypothetical protein
MNSTKQGDSLKQTIQPARKKIIFYGLTAAISLTAILLCLEVAAQIHAYVIDSKQYIDRSMNRFDKTLGWVLQDGTFRTAHIDFDVQNGVENGTRKTGYSHREGTPRIDFYGDSFCFGTGVVDEETIPAFLAKRFNGDAHVRNFGVSGYDPLQYILRYRSNPRPGNISVFLIYTGNDYSDLLSDVIVGGYGKPSMVKEGDGYKILPAKEMETVAVQREYDFQFRSFHFLNGILKNIPPVVEFRNQYLAQVDDKRVEEALARIDFLYRDLPRERTLFVLIPSISMIKNISVQFTEGHFARRATEHLGKMGFETLNLHQLGLLGVEDYWDYDLHTNVVGNRKIGDTVYEAITTRLAREL